MISPETHAQIRRYFYAEHWKIGTIARELNVHPDTVRNAIESDRFNRTRSMRPCITDPYMEFVRQTLNRHPRLRATRIYQMIHDRGYTGSVIQLRRAVALLRPPVHEPFLRLQTIPAESQVDYGTGPMVRDPQAGKYRRTRLFVLTLGFTCSSAGLAAGAPKLPRAWHEPGISLRQQGSGSPPFPFPPPGESRGGAGSPHAATRAAPAKSAGTSRAAAPPQEGLLPPCASPARTRIPAHRQIRACLNGCGKVKLWLVLTLSHWPVFR